MKKFNLSRATSIVLCRDVIYKISQQEFTLLSFDVSLVFSHINLKGFHV